MFRAVWSLFFFQCVFVESFKNEEFFIKVDDEFGALNSAAASMGWAAATKPSIEVIQHINRLNEVLAEWKRATCERLGKLWPLDARSAKAVEGLCRGAMYTAREAREITQLLGELRNIYENTLVCFESFCGRIEPELAQMMENNRDPDELLKAWFFWRNGVGMRSKNAYTELVEIMNIGAHRNGYSDIGVAWREELGITNVENKMEDFYNQILPLYESLHAVVRGRLREFYGDYQVTATGPLPAHLLGNMWGQSWSKLFDIVYKKPKYFKITENLLRNNTTVDQMVHLVEDFYTSLGFPKLRKPFWEYSKWENSQGTCHGTSVNMFEDDDYRILFCASVNEDDLHVLFHEIGHIQYFMAYQQQMNLFKDGASSAMHEAIGETIAMAAFSPGHLRRLGLIDQNPTPDAQLQYLLRVGLKILPQIPFSLMVDKWRWSVFRDDIGPQHYNKGWWTLREAYQGIGSPVARSEEDFDPASKFHIVDNVPYARYFIASILQFQIYEKMCEAANVNFTLHECDIYGSYQSSLALREMMQKGSSISFETAVKMSVNSTLSVEPLLRFFKPLKKWLDKEIAKNKYPVGWDE